ncbi:hypothetical protein IDT60_20575 (plasmid) [Pseudarthrobacter sp. BIM B-2242]|nr:hypothetical protein IDT60_20575 [Pseudarthrobacter sp. BIM B-2242]
MKLSVTKTVNARSLERRWNLSGAEPVTTHPLLPTVPFTPVDLRIWWQLSDGRWPETCSAHAWPAKDQDRDRNFASWDSTGGNYPAAMPEWVRDLAKVVRADLVANKTSPDTGAEDFWGYSLHRYWDVEDAGTVSDWRGPGFIPADLDISWSFYPGRPERDHRYGVYAHSAGRGDRGRIRDTGQWGGTRTRHDPDLPGWIRDLVDALYEELAATAKASTTERDAA